MEDSKRKKFLKDMSKIKNILEEPAAPYYVKRKKLSRLHISDDIIDAPETSYIKRAVQLMGMGNNSLFRNIENENDFIYCIRQGIPKSALDNIVNISGIANAEIPVIMRTSERTLRRYGPLQKLNTEQSERVIELAKLYSRGEEVFESLDYFKEWMNSTVMALGNKKPKEFLDTSLGIDLLMDELGRIEHGIFA